MINNGVIVFVGRFNPSIFHPDWFERYKILPIQDTQWALGEAATRKELEIGGAKVILSDRPPLVVQHDLAQVDFKSLQLSAQSNRVDFTVSDQENFALLKETVTKIFTLLEHTPINAVGINFLGDLQFEEQAENILKETFGKKNKLFYECFGDNYQLGGKIISSENNVQFTLNITLSAEKENSIHFDANFHRKLTTEQASEAIDVVNTNFDTDQDRLIAILKKLLGTPKSWN